MEQEGEKETLERKKLRSRGGRGRGGGLAQRSQGTGTDKKPLKAAGQREREDVEVQSLRYCLQKPRQQKRREVSIENSAAMSSGCGGGSC